MLGLQLGGGRGGWSRLHPKEQTPTSFVSGVERRKHLCDKLPSLLVFWSADKVARLAGSSWGFDHATVLNTTMKGI